MNVAWPVLPEKDRWLTEAMEQLLLESKQNAEELRRRARELREEASTTDIRGIRDASLALAECYEQTAASRPTG